MFVRVFRLLRMWRSYLIQRLCLTSVTWSLDALKRLARFEGWEGFLKKLRDADQDVLASKLSAWKQGLGLSEPFGGYSPGNHFFSRS